ncbi:hypothetical protein M1L23_14130 [Aliidiomarina sp. Y6]|nr:hypothetical protein [Aliidiomarina quisquiliarum]
MEWHRVWSRVTAGHACPTGIMEPTPPYVKALPYAAPLVDVTLWNIAAGHACPTGIMEPTQP